MIYIGCAKLGHTEAEVLIMTPRKFFKIFDEFLELNGIKKRQEKRICTIDDLP